MINKHDIKVAVRLFYSADGVYGTPRTGRIIYVDDASVAGNSLVGHYTKYQCRACFDWFDFMDIAPYIGEDDLCTTCADIEAAKHNCEACIRADWPSHALNGIERSATTIREERWLCEECADAIDEANSWS